MEKPVERPCIQLRSGCWRWWVEDGRGAPVLVLQHEDTPSSLMRRTLWSGASEELVRQDLDRLAALPEERRWVDERGTSWHVRAVRAGSALAAGGSTHRSRMVFLRGGAPVGSTSIPHDLGIGELTDDELRQCRDRLGRITGEDV